MTQLRIKLLAATVAALAASASASAQVTIGRGGVTIGNPNVGGYGNPNVGGYGFSQSPYYNGAYGQTPYRGTYPGWSGYNQPSVTTMPGRNYFPATGTYYNNPNPGYYTTPSGVVQQSSGYSMNTTNGVVQASGYTFPQQSNGMAQAGFSSPMNWSRDQIVSTQVLAPDGAQVTLSGTQADRDQGARPFISPPLEPNKTYTYRAKATWTDANGQTQTREKNVDVKAGQEVTIDLTRADADTSDTSNQNQNQSRTE